MEKEIATLASQIMAATIVGGVLIAYLLWAVWNMSREMDMMRKEINRINGYDEEDEDDDE